MPYDFYQNALDELRQNSLIRTQRVFESPQAPRAIIDGREMLLFASNSYLGLSGDPRLKEAAIQALDRYGVGAGGSRLTSGTYLIHQQLEAELARMKGREAALLFCSGFLANLSVIAALTGPGWVIYCDKLNHASIIDGCRLSGAELVPYRHCDMNDLAHKAARFAGKPGMIVTDGVFSMDGDIAPLPRILDIARRHCLLTMVDDAHSAGVLGENGGGTSEHFGLKGQVDIEMGTLSKAFAGEGGYIAADRVLTDYLLHKARGFVFSTAPSPVTAAVALQAVRISQADAARRLRLRQLSVYLAGLLKAGGWQTSGGETPILPVMIGPAETALAISRGLWEAGIFAPAIRPPTVKHSRLRLSLMATHTEEDCRKLADALNRAALQAGFHPEDGHAL